MREGDYLVGIGDTDVKWSSHGDVVKMIRDAENSLKLRLVTPLDRSLIKLQSSNLINSKPAKTVLSSSLSSPSSTTSSSSGLSMSACPVSSEETFSPASSESGKLLLIFPIKWSPMKQFQVEAQKITTVIIKSPGREFSTSNPETEECLEMTSLMTISISDKKWILWKKWIKIRVILKIVRYYYATSQTCVAAFN